MEAVTNILVNVAIGVLTIFGPPLAAKLTAWLHTHAKSTAANTSLTLIENVVRATVADIGQTVIPQFKAKLDTGTLSTADLSALTEAVLARLRTTFGQNSLDGMAKTLQMGGSIDQFLGSQVKLAVLALENPAAAVPTIPGTAASAQLVASAPAPVSPSIPAPAPAKA